MKKSRIIRLTALAVLAAMLLTVLCSCADTSGKTDDTTDPNTPADTTAPVSGEVTTSGGTVDTAPVTDEYGREVVDDELPTEDLGGRDFIVHSRGNVEQYEWKADRYTGDPLNDAIYERNEAVNDRYNINVVCLAEGTWADYNSTTLPKIKANIKSNEHAYDLIAGYSTPISTLATTGLLLDLHSIDYLDFDKPWWNDSINEALTIDDINYFGVGSLSLSMIYSLQCIIFNKTLLNIASNDGKEFDIYNCVENHEWTIDKMIEIAGKVHLDSDGKPDATDRFGIYFTEGTNTINGYLRAAGLTYIHKNADGDPVFEVDKAFASEVVDKVTTLLYNTPCACPVDKGTSVGCKFTDGNILFYDHWLYYVQTDISKQTSDYGIVPIPMLNTKQADYMTKVQSGMHMYCIPMDVEDADENGLITEALAAESYRSLVPAYFEICLKTKYSHDESAPRMIDILYNTATFDMGDMFDSNIGAATLFLNTVKSGLKNIIASSLEKQTTKIQSNLDKLVEGIRNPNAN